MASLLQTRHKIKSVQQTQKITKAMQLVSASKMKLFQKKAVSSRQYAWDLLHVLKNHLIHEERSPFFEKRKEGKTVFILYSSDKGLCGPLNIKLIKALLSSSAWTSTDPADRLLITIGKKALDFAHFNEIPVAESFKGIKENLSALDALEFIKPILQFWLEKKVKAIYMVAPHYKSTLVFYPLIKQFLPFSFDMIGDQLYIEGERKALTPPTNSFLYFEPGKDRIMEVLIEQTLHLLFMQAFFELKAAEYSSRMIAMQNATDNAADMIYALTLQFNKVRQAKITQEIAEISGAMAAL